MYAAHEDVGQGHVFSYADEWVTYTSQWFGIDAGGNCADASANVVYQVPQFWYNAISYASRDRVPLHPRRPHHAVMRGRCARMRAQGGREALRARKVGESCSLHR